MPRFSEYSRAALTSILARQYQVISRGQVLASGMPERVLEYRLRAGGPWQRLLPGVFLAVTATPTSDQRETAALLYAIHATTRMPEKALTVGPRRLAPLVRAVGDTARSLSRLADVRALVATVVQQGKCTPPMLAAELEDGPVQGSALLRIAVGDVYSGTRSNPEAELHDLLRRAKLPMPEFNPRLYVGEEFIGSPDAWWQYAVVAAEVDSNEYHLSPEDHERTTARDTRMKKHGINVLHFTPRQIRTQPAEVIAAIRSALTAPRFDPPVPIRAVSVAAAPALSSGSSARKRRLARPERSETPDSSR